MSHEHCTAKADGGLTKQTVTRSSAALEVKVVEIPIVVREAISQSLKAGKEAAREEQARKK